MTRQRVPSLRPFGPAVLGVVLASVLLAGCATTEESPAMNHAEAEAELNALFTAAQDSIGGEWENADSGAKACELPSGDTGAQSTFGRFGPGLTADKLQPAIDTIVSAWTEADFAPTVSTRMQGDVEFTAIGYPESGKGVDGLYVELMVNENGSGILGETRCVPGDYAEINREWQENNN